MPDASFPDLLSLAQHLRTELQAKKSVLIYAYNGTGKTRLSTEFKNLGKVVSAEGETTEQDTLYFNAFTEDLFSWDNDLANDRERVLKINSDSRFFAGLGELEMDNRIRPLLNRYADFDFKIDTIAWEVSFSRNVEAAGATTTVDDIKVSRGEENIFIWCFFLAIVQLVLDGAEAYKWVKYVYIDDPISSLDENNAVMVAHHLAQMLKDAPDRLRVVVSSHHVLFFNVLCNEMKKPRKYFLTRQSQAGGHAFAVRETDSTPFLYHLASLVELHEAQKAGALYTHHFNMLRRVMEQTACFFGYAKWDECIKPEADDPNQTVYKRVIDLMSHGDYSLYEPREMMPENKDHLRRVLKQFVSLHPFNQALFPEDTK
ncbi:MULTISPECIES: AAA family ATPase [unclassified Bradyrhizobium]|uniref:AAA family ATPase n=1 Tax=unclassified Bradyrhizobium TaxID=2631580 RepID=UPI0028E7497F|nr:MULTISPECIES: AAA family ATPase [unclassified Bradyrhizobium]